MQRIVSLPGLIVMVLLGLTGAAYAGNPAPTLPEPASMTLLAVGAGVIAIVKFRKRK